MGSIISSRAVALAALVVVGAMTAGCRESEQGRPLEFTPGTYQGAKGAELTEDQRKALRERAERGQ